MSSDHGQPPGTGLQPSPAVLGRPFDLLIVIPHLGPGGAQRVASLLANHWQKGDRQIGLLTLYDEPADAQTLSPQVIRLSLAQPISRGVRGRRHRLRRLHAIAIKLGLDGLLRLKRTVVGPIRRPAGAVKSYLRNLDRVFRVSAQRFPAAAAVFRAGYCVLRLRALFKRHKPRVIISFLGATNIQTILAAHRLRCKVVISERNDPAMQALKPPWEGLRPIVYPRADLVTANSQGAVQTLAAYVPSTRLRQVPNPLMLRTCAAEWRRHQPRLIAVARLVHQKGIDVLLDAFARIADEFPEWRLDIVGGGPLEDSLRAQAATLGIDNRVVLHGHQSDPFELLYQASIFVLPSRFEGMPNAMLEAMGCGLCIVATTASPGPLEFVQNGSTGLLVPSEDVASLSAALGRLMGDGQLRDRLSSAAVQRVQGLDVVTVAQTWEQLIRDVLHCELFRSELPTQHDPVGRTEGWAPAGNIKHGRRLEAPLMGRGEGDT